MFCVFRGDILVSKQCKLVFKAMGLVLQLSDSFRLYICIHVVLNVAATGN